MNSLEGILLRKTVFKEKDIICSFLTREGVKVSICFYGALKRVGKNSNHPLELGNMYRVILRSGGKLSNLLTAKEWDTIWRHTNITQDYKAYCYLCLLLEIGKVVAIEMDQSSPEISNENESLFNLLSNGLFYLDKDLAEKELNINGHMFMFLSRLLQFQGIFPEVVNCTFCEEVLTVNSVASLIEEEGGFCCKTCINDVESRGGRAGFPLWKELAESKIKKFANYRELLVSSYALPEHLLNYLAIHEVIIPSRLKSLPALHD